LEQGRFATADGRFWRAMEAGVYGRSIHFIGDPA
jgi:hypothetical protein